MASIEHCIYCFESLAANFEERKPLSLLDLQRSWADYSKSEDAKTSKQLPALRRIAASETSSGTSSPSSASSTSLAADTPATSVTSLSGPADLITESPLFVTWNTISKGGHRSLRGCIGTFESQDLDAGLGEYALVSALQDSRFPPVEAAELPTLEVGVTLLTDFEDCADAMDWTLGLHGLRISFSYHGRRYGSTYLPDVAPEQGWNKEETVVSLMRKAGWMGRRDRWREVELKVVRYRGKARYMEYAVYKEWRDWLDKKRAVA